MIHTFGYLDPGSASMIIQLIVGGAAAAAVALKLFWRRILSFLHIRSDDPPAEAASEPDKRG